MAIKGKKYKNKPDTGWKTQHLKLDRAARLEKNSAQFSEPGMYEPMKIQFVPLGKSPSEEYWEVEATAGEWDFQIPGEGTPQDWQNMPHNGLIHDYTSCSPSVTEMTAAYKKRSHQPGLIRDVVQDLARCVNLEGYDYEPTVDELVQKSKEVSEQIDKSETVTNKRLELLALSAELANKPAPWIQNWAKGPNYLLAFAKKAKVQAKTDTKPNKKVLAQLLAADVLAVTAADPNAEYLIYSLGEAVGQNWNDWLASALKLADDQAEKAEKDAFALKKAQAKAMGVPLSAVLGPKPRAMPKASGAFSKKKMRDEKRRQTDVFLRGEREIYESQARAKKKLKTDAIALAIEWFLECETPGNVGRFQTPGGEGGGKIEIICGDPTSFARLNPPEIAQQLTDELSTQLELAGKPPIPKAVGAQGSILPWILGAGGLFVGGPLGAGAGYALGIAMEKK